MMRILSTIQTDNILITDIASLNYTKRIVGVGAKGLVQSWSLQTGEIAFSLTGHQNTVYSVDIDTEDEWLLTAGQDEAIKLWNLNNQTEQATLLGHTDWINSVKLSRFNQTAISGASDHSVRYWDLPTKVVITVFDDHQNEINSVSFFEHMIASGSADKTIILWDQRSQKRQTQFFGHTNHIESVCFSPNGYLLASGSKDNQIKIWDVRQQKLLSSLLGHDDWVNAVDFDSDGQLLLSASKDAALNSWDLTTFKKIHSYSKHTKPIMAMKTTQGRVVTLTSDSNLHEWSSEPAAFYLALKALTTDEEILTAVEQAWQRDCQQKEPVSSLRFLTSLVEQSMTSRLMTQHWLMTLIDKNQATAAIKFIEAGVPLPELTNVKSIKKLFIIVCYAQTEKALTHLLEAGYLHKLDSTSYRLLQHACKTGNISFVIRLLGYGFDINAKHHQDHSPVDEALRRGFVSLAQTLIIRGGRLNTTQLSTLPDELVTLYKDRQKHLLLWWKNTLARVSNQTTELNIGSDGLSSRQLLQLVNKLRAQKVPMHLLLGNYWSKLSPYDQAFCRVLNLRGFYWPTIKSSLAQTPSGKALFNKGLLTNTLREANVTLLHLTAGLGNLSHLTELAEKGYDLKVRDNMGQTALDWAIWANQSDCIAWLRKHQQTLEYQQLKHAVSQKKALLAEQKEYTQTIVINWYKRFQLDEFGLLKHELLKIAEQQLTPPDKEKALTLLKSIKRPQELVKPRDKTLTQKLKFIPQKTMNNEHPIFSDIHAQNKKIKHYIAACEASLKVTNQDFIKQLNTLMQYFQRYVAVAITLPQPEREKWFSLPSLLYFPGEAPCILSEEQTKSLLALMGKANKQCESITIHSARIRLLNELTLQQLMLDSLISVLPGESYPTQIFTKWQLGNQPPVSLIVDFLTPSATQSAGDSSQRLTCFSSFDLSKILVACWLTQPNKLLLDDLKIFAKHQTAYDNPNAPIKLFSGIDLSAKTTLLFHHYNKQIHTGERVGQSFYPITNLLYCLPQLQEPISPDFQQTFLTSVPALVLLTWLEKLDTLNKVYQQLNKGFEMTTLSDSNILPDTSTESLPIQFQPGTIRSLYLKLTYLQNWFQSHKQVTLNDLFYHIEPDLWQYYQSIQKAAYQSAKNERWDLQGYLEICHRFLKATQTTDYDTAMAYCSGEPIEEFLLAQKGKVDVEKAIQKNSQQTIAQAMTELLCCLSWATYSDDTKKTIDKLVMKTGLIDFDYKSPLTLFCQALTYHGHHPKLFDHLVQYFSIESNCPLGAYSGQSLLLLATSCRQSKSVEWLLERGAEIEQTNLKGRTALHIAFSVGDVESIAILLAHQANTMAKDKDGKIPREKGEERGWTAARLLFAAIKAHLSYFPLFDYLLQYINYDDRNNQGETILMAAVHYQHDEVIAYLIKNEKVDINALLRPVSQSKLENDSAATITLPPLQLAFGCTSLHIAAAKGNTAHYDTLLIHGADENQLDERNQLPIHYAVSHGQLELTSYIIRENSLMLQLKNQHGETLLHLAARKNLVSMIKLLLELGADLSSLNAKKETPLMLANRLQAHQASLILSSRTETFSHAQQAPLQPVFACSSLLPMSYYRNFNTPKSPTPSTQTPQLSTDSDEAPQLKKPVAKNEPFF